MLKRKWFRLGLKLLAALVIILNVISFMHAYRFTHFQKSAGTNDSNIESMGIGVKLEILFTGVRMQKPQNSQHPGDKFSSITIQNQTQAWWITQDSAIGNVILFHGYKGCKSNMVNRARLFNQMGFNTLIVDFMGSGEDRRYKTSLGYYESDQVKQCFEWVDSVNPKPIYLLGSSMGAAAVMRAVSVHQIQPEGIIIESPYYSLRKATQARFRTMGLPSTPFSELLLFWGGVQQGFNPFELKPIQYAGDIHCRTLIMNGDQDYSISEREAKSIFDQLKGPRQQVTFKRAGHEDFYFLQKKKYTQAVKSFIAQNPNSL